MFSAQALHAMPKIDLHRHLEGSLRLETLSEMARTHGINVGNLPTKNTDMLRPHVQIIDDPQDHEVFLAKFGVLRHFYHSPEAVARLTYEAIVDAAADNVRYLELRFSPQALSRVQGFCLAEVTDWVIEATQQARRVCQIDVGLIVTLLRHESLDLAEQVARVAFDRAEKGIVGLDLAGDEVKFSAFPFRDLFQEAARRGLGVTIHAGEWTNAASVRVAVEELGAVRIGHGVRVIDDPEVMELVRQEAVALELCLTSNVQTGAVPYMASHPARQLLHQGVAVTLNTDDPCVSNCTLTDEYVAAVQQLGFDSSDLEQVSRHAARAAFLPMAQRLALEAQILNGLPSPDLEPA